MDIQDSNSTRDKNSSFDWKDSFYEHDAMIRRVHSTPLMLPNVSNTCSNESVKPKKLFVSFRQDVEEDFDVRPALSYRSLQQCRPQPEPDCIVLLCQRKFRCSIDLLQEFSLLFRQLSVTKHSGIPLVLNSAKQIFPNSFWLVYQWMHAKRSNDKIEFINLHWVADLYLASKYLAIQELQETCYRYLTDREKVKEEKAFFIFCGLSRYEANDLNEYLVSLIQASFTALAGTKDFLDLNCEQVLQILYSQYISISGEVEVFYAGVRWLMDHIEEREVYTEEIMSTVRFHFMELKQLLKVCREFPRITGKSPVSLMIEQAIRVAVLKEVNHTELNNRFLTHLPNARNSCYKPSDQQVQSYREFLHLSRRKRELNSRIYHSLSRLDFPKTRFVEDMDNLYTNWKINNSSWDSLQTKSAIRKTNHTFN